MECYFLPRVQPLELPRGWEIRNGDLNSVWPRPWSFGEKSTEVFQPILLPPTLEAPQKGDKICSQLRCGFKTRSTRLLQLHWHVNHNPNRTIVCPNCKLTFSTIPQYGQHCHFIHQRMFLNSPQDVLFLLNH